MEALERARGVVAQSANTKNWYCNIEPAHGLTYSGNYPVLYFYDEYERSSVNYGTQMRIYVWAFDSWDEAEDFQDAHKTEFRL